MDVRAVGDIHQDPVAEYPPGYASQDHLRIEMRCRGAARLFLIPN